MSQWYYLPADVPDPDEQVWVRLGYMFEVPFQATWDDTGKTFTSIDNAIIYPAWSVSKWRRP